MDHTFKLKIGFSNSEEYFFLSEDCQDFAESDARTMHFIFHTLDLEPSVKSLGPNFCS